MNEEARSTLSQSPARSHSPGGAYWDRGYTRRISTVGCGIPSLSKGKYENLEVGRPNATLFWTRNIRRRGVVEHVPPPLLYVSLSRN